MPKITKARFWTGVLYPENMREDWEITIGDVVQYPYAYCKHTRDKDSKSEHRKDHVHLLLAFPNTTTYQHALSVFGASFRRRKESDKQSRSLRQRA